MHQYIVLLNLDVLSVLIFILWTYYAYVVWSTLYEMVDIISKYMCMLVLNLPDFRYLSKYVSLPLNPSDGHKI